VGGAVQWHSQGTLAHKSTCPLLTLQPFSFSFYFFLVAFFLYIYSFDCSLSRLTLLPVLQCPRNNITHRHKNSPDIVGRCWLPYSGSNDQSLHGTIWFETTEKWETEKKTKRSGVDKNGERWEEGGPYCDVYTETVVDASFVCLSVCVI
jgi:hypothetical protein